MSSFAENIFFCTPIMCEEEEGRARRVQSTVTRAASMSGLDASTRALVERLRAKAETLRAKDAAGRGFGGPAGEEDAPPSRSSGAACSSFEEMGLKSELLRGMVEFGYERPSEVQQTALPLVLTGRDAILQAQSGTGKTSLVAVACCQVVRSLSPKVQAVVLSPSRELAVQTASTAASLGRHLKGLGAHAAVGGKLTKEDARALARGVQVVSGTPGRVLDLLRRHKLREGQVKLLVLDEADEMLSAGFAEQIYGVYRLLPSGSQIVLISATMPPEVLELSERFMAAPVRVVLKAEELALRGIRQFFTLVDGEEWKLDALVDACARLRATQCVVFCNARKKVDWLTLKLRGAGMACAAAHGQMNQRERDRVMKEFRAGKAKVLLSTDVWARGIDVRGVNLVVNYDLPRSKDTYLHRIGRTGRFGRQGVALNLVRAEDVPHMRDIEKHYAVDIAELPRDLKSLLPK